MQFVVTLRPLTGEIQTKLGKVPVEHHADIVMVAGQEIHDAFGVPTIEVGYAGHQYQGIDFLPHVRLLGPGAVDRICAEVARLTGRPRQAHLPAQHATDPGKAASPVDLDRPQAVVAALDLGT